MDHDLEPKPGRKALVPVSAVINPDPASGYGAFDPRQKPAGQLRDVDPERNESAMFRRPILPPLRGRDPPQPVMRGVMVAADFPDEPALKLLQRHGGGRFDVVAIALRDVAPGCAR